MPPSAPRVFLVALVAALLAGCSGPAPESADAAPVPDAAVQRPPIVFTADLRLSYGATAGAPEDAQPYATYYWVERDAGPAFRFPVLPDATALLVEMTWPDPSDSLLLHVAPPGSSSPFPPPDRGLYDRGGEPLGGGQTRRILVESPEAGDWTAQAHADPVAENAPYTVHASVFYDGPVPDGYTAIPS